MREISTSVLKSFVKALSITAVACAFVSVIMLLIDISDNLLGYIAIALLAAFCYMCSYFSTQINRSKGLLQGFVCGISVFILVYIVNFIFSSFQFSSTVFVKFVVCLAFGIFGGVKGINTKHTKVHK